MNALAWPFVCLVFIALAFVWWWRWLDESKQRAAWEASMNDLEERLHARMTNFEKRLNEFE